MILVTGGTGLLGSHLLYKLSLLNEPVRAMFRNKEKIENVKKIFSYYSSDSEQLIKKIDWCEGDLLDLYSLNEAFKNVRKIYHCAAQVSFNSNNKNQLIKDNLQGTENVVELCLQHDVEKLCHVSSIASLGGSLNGEFIDENSKWSSAKNHSAYSVSKFKSEMAVWRGIEEGLNAVIVNPSVILGPGLWNSGSGSLFVKAAKGMRYFTSGSTGFVDVRDVVNLMTQLMESEHNAERFVISSENLDYADLFNMVADEIKIKRASHEATKKMLKLALYIDWLASKLGIKKREITEDVIRSSLTKSKYSTKKINEAFHPTWIPIKTSIHDIAEKFKKELTIS
ncbi:MAG TPA: NAD-dependent epimerase [Bacteroidales bacterium]|nr:NAD-dependent epimerase [Bacteroidales bacterium]